jgi:hypothetical protein
MERIVTFLQIQDEEEDWQYSFDCAFGDAKI